MPVLDQIFYCIGVAAEDEPSVTIAVSEDAVAGVESGLSQQAEGERDVAFLVDY
ncbi:hypothetical protein [Streptacidiphilus pinicola]|uniref:hypothetical protein n=1 Tax=Streptacidiphilus pinicola TaxID=2219663 RepID=UPI001A9D6F97|nr:hypothetical protein [Streptacidiphilus pinicola]